jgi:hypothetical protein
MLVLEFGDETLVIDASDRGNRIVPSIQSGSPDAGQGLATPMQGISLRRGMSKDVSVRLQPHQVLHRRLQLPDARMRVLRKAVQYELDRVSPLESGRILFDVQCLGRDRSTRRATLAVRMIKRDLADQINATCRAWGLKIAELHFPGTTPRARWRLFPVDRLAAGRTLLRRRCNVLLSGLAVALGLSVVTTEYLRGAATERAAIAELEAERAEAGALRRIRTDIDRAVDEIQFFAAQREAPLFVVLLTDLSGLLPNDAWLTDVELSQRTVRLRGYAASASRLIAIFELSQRFAKAQFGAPSRRGPSAETEQFDLSVEIESRL